jgi:hypothetical protein
MHPSLAINNIRVLEEAGGWIKVLESFVTDQVAEMRRYPGAS